MHLVLEKRVPALAYSKGAGSILLGSGHPDCLCSQHDFTRAKHPRGIGSRKLLSQLLPSYFIERMKSGGSQPEGETGPRIGVCHYLREEWVQKFSRIKMALSTSTNPTGREGSGVRSCLPPSLLQPLPARPTCQDSLQGHPGSNAGRCCCGGA